jgi:hypothetical protein
MSQGRRPNRIKTGEEAMDFIERIFGISPDVGSGSFEMMLLFIPAAAVIGYIVYKRKRRTPF